MCMFACPTSSRLDDPLLNPRLSCFGCEKVLVCLAEKDFVRDGVVLQGGIGEEWMGRSGGGYGD